MKDQRYLEQQFLPGILSVDRFDEIIGLLKQGNIYGEEKNISMGAVEVPIVKQIAIDKASTKGLKSEVFENTTESKLKKLRKLKRGY